MVDNDTIWVVTADLGATRGFAGATKLKLGELSENVNRFVEQMGSVLRKTPEVVGKFQLVDFEIHAEVSAKGTLAVLGTGGEAGAAGGIKFVFRRVPLEAEK
jgi:hypothetical protein